MINIPSNTCPICSNKKLQKLQYKNEHFSFLIEKNKDIFKNLNILSCLQCGFSYTFPFIDTYKLSEFYENEYSSEGGPHFNPYDIRDYKWKNKFSSRAASQFMLAAQYTDISKIENFMDIGCGHGESFSILNKMKCRAKYYALEGGKNYQQHLKDLNVNIIDWNSDTLYLDKKYEDFFDLILMSHVLEHFNAIYLKSILININRYLKSGGVFICEVPNDDSNYKLLGSANHAPHLSFFSKNSLSKIMEDCGYLVKYINCVGPPIGRDAINNNEKGNFKIRLKRYVYKYSTVRKIFYLFWHIFRHISALKKYYLSNHTMELLSSKDFVYGNERASIRICVVKK